MNEEKNSANNKMTSRFKALNLGVGILLIITIFVSIYQFGGKAWSGRGQFALVIPATKDTHGWDGVHYQAMRNIANEFDIDLVLRENVSGEYQTCMQVADELVKRGVKEIFFVNGFKVSGLRELEKKYPHITCSTIESISVLLTKGQYSIATLQGTYLAGILAGLHTKTNKVGYIAPFPDSELYQEINAFAMGVQRVNPNAEILLCWTNAWNNPASEEQAVQNLKAQRVDVLAYHQNGDTVPNTAERAGINFISYNEAYQTHKYFLGAVLINWRKISADLLKFGDNTDNDSNYVFYTLGNGGLIFATTDQLSMREKVAVEEARWEVKNGRLIFSGDIFDTNDVKRCSANEAISFYGLQNMDWLIKGVRVVGS